MISSYRAVLVVNDDEGTYYGCCDKKVGWFPSYYVTKVNGVN